LTPEALNMVAFALQASDALEWEDQVISEVLSDWSAPEVNFELNAETLKMHRDWLLGLAFARPACLATHSGNNVVVPRRAYVMGLQC
jgi:hypothetical protein